MYLAEGVAAVGGDRRLQDLTTHGAEGVEGGGGRGAGPGPGGGRVAHKKLPAGACLRRGKRERLKKKKKKTEGG